MSESAILPTQILAGLRQHPRLIISSQRITEIQHLTKTDNFAAQALTSTIAAADKYIQSPPLTEPIQEGLTFANNSLGLVTTCGFAWRLTNDRRYLDCARARLLVIAAAPPWKREDFLAIGELAYAVGLGYDWLRNDLSSKDQATIRSYLAVGILDQAKAAYLEGDWWIDTTINWNHECNGGIIVAALAVADSHPELAQQVLPSAIHWLGHALDGYEPDGGWEEGAGYWNRATIFAVYALASLETALGTDFGLSDRRGFSDTARFYLSSIGPTGRVACYADCSDARQNRSSVPAILWLAKRYQRPEYAQSELTYAKQHRAHPAHLWWYEPPIASEPMVLDQRFRAPGNFVSMRSSWDDPHALFAWIKGGNNQVNHGHLDLGNFEVDALGERWSRDLGVDSYALPGYFDRIPGGKRWEYFRMNSLSHSVPTISGKIQEQAAFSRITTFIPDAHNPRAIAELSEAYTHGAHHARRGLMLVERKSVLIQDEFSLKEPCDFTWAMTTDAEITLDGARAQLSLGGQRMTATILEPAEAVFSQESAERLPPERPNTGVRRLLASVSQAKGHFRIAILLSPHWPDEPVRTAAPIVPLGMWVHPLPA